MPSFVDKLRSQPPGLVRRVTVAGFDPDIDVAGWGQVSAVLTPDLAPTISWAKLGIRSFKHHLSKDLDRSNAAVCDLCADGGAAILGDATCVVIESQQLWPDPDMDRAQMFSKAKSLLRISQVTGAVQALALARGMSAAVVLPQTWKGQRLKHVDHARSLRALGRAGLTLTEYTSEGPAVAVPLPPDLASKPGKWEHAMDGLGMALFGLDLIATNRWSE